MKDKLQKFNIVLNLIFAALLLGGWTYTLDMDRPLGSEAPSVLDDMIRLTRDGFQERLNVEHNFELTGTELSGANVGKHTDITCDSIVNAGAYTGTTLTTTGDLTINTNKFVVTAGSGDVTVAGTFSATGVSTLADASLLATSAAPTTDAMIVNKKYVDDLITALANSRIKGWVNFDGDSGTINGTGYNITSVVRNSTGNYTITWGTDFANDDYAIAGFVADAANSAGFVCHNSSDNPLATGTTTITTCSAAGPVTDYNLVTVIAIGTQ